MTSPRTLGEGAFGGTLCGPVFQAFMEEAIKKYGGAAFRVPPGGHFINIDRFTGERLPDEMSGEYVQAEYFRDGEDADLRPGRAGRRRLCHGPEPAAVRVRARSMRVTGRPSSPRTASARSSAEEGRFRHL